MQMVEVELDPGETVIAEAGAMTYMEKGIGFEAKTGDGSSVGGGLFGKLLSAGKVWLQSLPFSRMADRILAGTPGPRRQRQGRRIGAGRPRPVD